MKKVIFLFVILLFTILISCKDENEEIDYNPNLNTAIESIWAQMAFNDVFNFVFMATKDTALINSGYNVINGAQVYYTESPNPKMRFRFPGYFFQCPDDCNRRGEYHAEFNGPVDAAGTSASITYMEYYFEFIRLDAVHLITYEGQNQSQQDSYHNIITSGNLLVMDTISPWAYTWNADQQLTWFAGGNTPGEHQDDKFEVTGNSDGKSSSGTDYHIEISSALVNVPACQWIPWGIQNISTPALLIRSGQIDFIQADSCNDYVDFVFDGNPFYWQLKKIR